MNPANSLIPELPDDIPAAIRAKKQEWRRSIGDVQAVFDEVAEFIAGEVADIEQCKAEGKPVWPVIDYQDIADGTVSAAQIDAIHRRGCAVIKGHFAHSQALSWDQSLVEYVERNDFDRQYRGPGDDFFGTLSASRPEIYPIYWSAAQMEARQSDRMATVQTFLNQLWKYQSEGKTWFDPQSNCIYPDRVRRRPPGTNSKGLGPHTDSGALERWLLPAYNRVFRHLLNGDFSRYDPWDAAYRTDVHEYQGGTTMCSAFRTFQGWTALSDMQHEQGVLFTVPIPAAMAYILLRAILDDVADDDLCGVQPRLVLPLAEKWHSLLLRAKTTIPDIRAGDSIWWHCDVIHGVEEVSDQQGWGNVMYIPASPVCEKNVRYAALCKDRFDRGESPDDFPSEHYEMNWQGRFSVDQLNERGRQSFCPD